MTFKPLDLNLIPCETPEDIFDKVKDSEVLVWDGCQFHVDYVESDVDTGAFYMANGSEPIAWHPLVEPESTGVQNQQPKPAKEPTT